MKSRFLFFLLCFYSSTLMVKAVVCSDLDLTKMASISISLGNEPVLDKRLQATKVYTFNLNTTLSPSEFGDSVIYTWAIDPTSSESVDGNAGAPQATSKQFSIKRFFQPSDIGRKSIIFKVSYTCEDDGVPIRKYAVTLAHLDFDVISLQSNSGNLDLNSATFTLDFKYFSDSNTADRKYFKYGVYKVSLKPNSLTDSDLLESMLGFKVDTNNDGEFEFEFNDLTNQYIRFDESGTQSFPVEIEYTTGEKQVLSSGNITVEDAFEFRFLSK
ncbi:MAG: hypothetical protein LW817_08570, partial [Candidatus Caenarcaniphilales bacterium]|nr:hypothetical protein [Candidatus Caenarcaniphilales bacterium]